MTIDIQLFKNVMARFPSGVVVITTNYMGVNYGFTASSFKSLSLDPPLILFSLSKSSSSHEAFFNSNYYGISILSCDQISVSENFATRSIDRFEKIDHSYNGQFCPLISNAVGYFSCEKYQIYPGGDHSIFLGKVIDASLTKPEKSPLIYYNRNYEKDRNNRQ